MAVILLILKIIGIILAIILGILLLLAVLILFVPVRYSVRFENQDEMMVGVKVSWLLHLIRVFAVFRKENLDFKVKILFFTFPRKRAKEKVKESTVKEAVKETTKDVEQATKEVITTVDEEEQPPKKESDSSKKPEKTNHKKRGKKAKHSPHDFSNGFRNVIAFVQNEENKQLISLCFSLVKDLLVHVFPRKATGNITFSIGSPDLTGQVLGLISLMPFVYDKNMHIYPDFMSEEPYVKGQAVLYGRVQLFVLVRMAVRLLKDKTVRRLIKQIRKK